MLMYSEALGCYGTLLLLIAPPLPILSVAPHHFPIYCSICKDKYNQAGSAVFLLPNSHRMWMGLTAGLCHDCPKQSNPAD